jgi:hypothetical protein
MDQISLARAKRAMLLIFAADALSMPAHWFYNPADIRTYFGANGVTRMLPAPSKHPSSLMPLHSTSGGGRGGQGGSREVVGSVILKDKREKWGKQHVHYHDGMPAGENTLNAYCARLMIRDVLTPHAGSYDADAFLHRYVEMMTADPPRHPDTYAESYHRGFFKNLHYEKKPIRECAEKTHDTPSVGGLVTIAPLALSELLLDGHVARVQAVARAHLAFTHPDDTLAAVCDEYVALLASLLTRAEDVDDREIILRAAARWVRDPSTQFSSRNTLFNSKNMNAEDRNTLDATRRYIDRTPATVFVGRIVSSACYI